MKELFCDGVAGIALSHGMVFLDLFHLVSSPNGPSERVPFAQIILPWDGFLGLFDTGNAVKSRLTEVGIFVNIPENNPPAAAAKKPAATAKKPAAKPAAPAKKQEAAAKKPAAKPAPAKKQEAPAKPAAKPAPAKKQEAPAKPAAKPAPAKKQEAPAKKSVPAKPAAKAKKAK